MMPEVPALLAFLGSTLLGRIVGVLTARHPVLTGRALGGGGKTTPPALLRRLRDLDRNLVDGIGTVTLDPLRAGIGAVFQESLPFDRADEDELRVGRPEASRAGIEAAARDAGAQAIITARRHGCRTIVDKRGVRFPGGDGRRLATARPMRKNAPILVQGTATAVLDAPAGAWIRAALRRLRHGRSGFVTAHRPSTVRGTGLVPGAGHGRIVGLDGPESLIAANGRFAHSARLLKALKAAPALAAVS